MLGILPHVLGNKSENVQFQWIGDDRAGDNATVQVLKNGKVFNRHLNTTVEIPGNYFFMDNKDIVKQFQLHIMFFTKNWVSNLQTLPTFVDRDAWVIKQNYLYSRFKYMLARLVESGLYSRWDEYYSKLVTVRLMRDAAKEVGETLGEKNKRSSVVSISNLFHYVFLNERKKHDHKPETIPVKVYLMIGAYGLIFLAFSCIMLLIEVGLYSFSRVMEE
ncbi:unnamed protein product [Orchesella dallaii]|uniref:Uncharacterized protein n=1 Tax=Orchesella dallaii TaxID=48710 RepID=A0ABP1RPF5_9HEXA